MEDELRTTGLLTKSARPSIFWKLFALSFMGLVLNFGMSFWHVTGVSGLFGHNEKPSWNSPSHWTWEPYAQEREQYLRHHYNLNWMDSSSANNLKRIGGKISPFFELLALRLYGFFYYCPYLIVSVIFSASLGSVRYYDKMLYFGNISSTINNIAIKTFIIVLLLAILWCSLPLGMKFPVVGGIPIEINFPVLGLIWLSNPAIGALLFGVFYSVSAYLIGANFSREI